MHRAMGDGVWGISPRVSFILLSHESTHKGKTVFSPPFWRETIRSDINCANGASGVPHTIPKCMSQLTCPAESTDTPIRSAA